MLPTSSPETSLASFAFASSINFVCEGPVSGNFKNQYAWRPPPLCTKAEGRSWSGKSRSIFSHRSVSHPRFTVSMLPKGRDAENILLATTLVSRSPTPK